MFDEHQSGLTKAEREDAKELAAPRSPVIYEVVRRQGEEELRRSLGSLFWSGIAAGVTIMASVIAEGALRHKLPADAPWRDAVADLGYSLGFLMVILGRMQLFYRTDDRDHAARHGCAGLAEARSDRTSVDDCLCRQQHDRRLCRSGD